MRKLKDALKLKLKTDFPKILVLLNLSGTMIHRDDLIPKKEMLEKIKESGRNIEFYNRSNRSNYYREGSREFLVDLANHPRVEVGVYTSL